MKHEYFDDLNIYVFTTRFVLDGDSPITYVSHDKNGDWQFLGSEDNLKIEDSRIVALKEILAKDSSLHELSSLPLGRDAIRENKFQRWRIL